MGSPSDRKPSGALTILNIKQNQIVKVFTIITAVFLPPTLVATFYGMNFSVMPELSWKHGFTMSIVLTLVAALLPLVYIKRKGCCDEQSTHAPRW